MRRERREQQNLNLDAGTDPILRNRIGGDEAVRQSQQLSFLPDRWSRISLRAQNGSSVFNNIQTHINVDSLKEAFKAIDGSKALGVDGISKSVFGKNLEENLAKLAQKVQRGSYRPEPKREVLIPKANGKTRPIAIACFEDKLVDWVIGKILSAIYEPTFIKNSFGYRPNKSADGAIKTCYYSLHKNRRKYILEIDFSNFFNTIPHDKLMRILKKKITDERFKRLIGRILVAETLGHEGELLPSEVGTPQGSIMSPILANIYLNEVIDQWFKENYQSYDNMMVRYADDGVFFFKDEETCHRFKEALKKRIESFGLSLNEEKTKVIDFSKSKNNQLDFLGLTLYWGKQGSRRLLKIKTEKTKLKKGIKEFDQWIKKSRITIKLQQLWKIAKSKIRGHINYYGYQGNQLKISYFIFKAIGSLFKWLNRRSQKRSYRWEGFKERLKNFPLSAEIKDMRLKQLGWNPYVH
jgi:group II intron reverse transcriptase/maturase